LHQLDGPGRERPHRRRLRRVVTQVPTLDQLGNSGVLREMLASSNVIVLRTGGPMSGQVALHGTLPVEPHKIPKQ
jgi:hypothetical protein